MLSAGNSFFFQLASSWDQDTFKVSFIVKWDNQSRSRRMHAEFKSEGYWCTLCVKKQCLLQDTSFKHIILFRCQFLHDVALMKRLQRVQRFAGSEFLYAESKYLNYGNRFASNNQFVAAHYSNFSSIPRLFGFGLLNPTFNITRLLK